MSLRVSGVEDLVPTKLDLGMDDILAMPVRELPVTLVCSGNRRKEQNMVRQTIGFNWGAGGVSTQMYGRVYYYVMYSEKNMAGKHVKFIGA